MNDTSSKFPSPNNILGNFDTGTDEDCTSFMSVVLLSIGFRLFMPFFKIYKDAILGRYKKKVIEYIIAYYISISGEV